MKQRGFSFVEVLVAVGISAIVGSAMYALVNNALGSSNYFADRQELDEAARQVQFILLRDSDCAESIRATGDQPVAFTGTQVNIDRIQSATLGQKSVLLQSNQAYGRIRIGQITLTEATNNSQRPQPQIFYEGGVAVSYDTFFATLTIPATSRTGRTLDRRQIPLKLYVPIPPASNPSMARNIRRCHVRHADNQMCGSFGGTFNQVSGVCDMRPCTVNTVAANMNCRPPPPGWTCSPAVYFWGFANDDAASLTGPQCLCVQSCQPPAPPPPPPTGAPAGGPATGGARGY